MTEPTSSSDTAFNDSLNFIKTLWGSMGVPGTNTSGMTMPTMHGMAIPTLSVEELDKHIQELRSVEAWLTMNVTMLHNSIKALEIQRATLATLHSLSSPMSSTTPGSPDQPDFSPLINQSAAWWHGVQEQFKQALGAALANNSSAAETKKKPVKRTRKATVTKAKSTNNM